jgi:hydroxymethylglutaryl-CoA lyase
MKKVKITEVGPRDGLQNEKAILPTQAKLKFIQYLNDAGIQNIEVTSFVRPDRIPALADAEELSRIISVSNHDQYSCLVPNLKGYEKARNAGYKEVAIFGAASETFSQKNINKTIHESIQSFREIADSAKKDNIKLRGYISTVVACPYEGKINPNQVLHIVEHLADLGVYEISLGETIGVGVPSEIAQLLEVLLNKFSTSFFAGHFHDTHGMAIANVQKALEMGLRSFDSSAGGLGGCPYAPGAAGNLATEDLVYLLQRSGYETNINLKALVKASEYMSKQLSRTPNSKTYLAEISKQNEV